MSISMNNPYFDLSYLNQVFQGNRDLINQIISLFLDQVPHYIHDMEMKVEENKLNELHPLAHKAKSSIAMLGMKNMEQLVLQIEFNSKNGKETEKLPAMVRELVQMNNSACGQLREWVTRSSAA
jgi:HPt (histidine-containing phosphotransfer) domain-containing protein